METFNTEIEDRAYTKNVAIGSYYLARLLTQAETNDERKKKKKRVLERKQDLARDTFDVDLRRSAEDLLITDWPVDQAKAYLIDMTFSNPFAPYELNYSDTDFQEALKKLAKCFEVPEDTIDSILDTKRGAIKAHNSYSWSKVIGYGTIGLVVIGLGGYFAAPAIGAALGGAAGLTGAAATAHGLALLGGGSLAAGGSGMAGGLWLVTSVGAAAGSTVASGGALLMEIGAAGARTELSKLQVTYKEILLHNQVHNLKAQEALKSLREKRDRLKESLDEERTLNEKNAGRVEELEEKVDALENALNWMEEAA